MKKQFQFCNNSVFKAPANIPTATALTPTAGFPDFTIRNLILKFVVRKPNANKKASLIESQSFLPGCHNQQTAPKGNE